MFVISNGFSTLVNDERRGCEAFFLQEFCNSNVCCSCDNVHCVEALIHASSHETNDDDVDGRTPLLLSSAHGHHQVVQVLLSLGGDLSNR